MSNTKTLTEQIEAKRDEVTNYERIMATYQGRWWHNGRDSLRDLRKELADLEAQISTTESTGV